MGLQASPQPDAEMRQGRKGGNFETWGEEQKWRLSRYVGNVGSWGWESRWMECWKRWSPRAGLTCHRGGSWNGVSTLAPKGWAATRHPLSFPVLPSIGAVANLIGDSPTPYHCHLGEFLTFSLLDFFTCKWNQANSTCLLTSC